MFYGKNSKRSIRGMYTHLYGVRHTLYLVTNAVNSVYILQPDVAINPESDPLRIKLP